MRAGFYFKLAVTGIRKNKKLYTPFILTCIGMTAMHYIILFLSEVEILDYMSGGGTMQTMLFLGSRIMVIFAGIFLFYTNSFLIRRRKKEFGLYNILGMGKRNISRIMCWETVIIAAFSLLTGTGCGIVLSKLAELGLINIVNAEVNYSFSLSPSAVLWTMLNFGVIFVLLLLNALFQVKRSDPMSLLRSENTGERPPKGNWLFGLVGVLLLVGAYWLAVTIDDPVAALVMFVVAVIMVIIATYLLFIAGSVCLCRLLQKNKAYYYRPNHFVAVSSMAYRMKRNGAGLASICILATMVLVMLSGSACLYFGAEDSLRARYPRDISVDARFETPQDMSEDNIALLREEFERIAAENHVEITNVLDYRCGQLAGLLTDGVLETDAQAISAVGMTTSDSVYQFFFIPLADYNRLMGKEEILGENQVLIYSKEMKYTGDRFAIHNGPEFEVKQAYHEALENGSAAMNILPAIFVIVPDFEGSIDRLVTLKDYNGDPTMYFHWNYGFDSDADAKAEIAVREEISKRMGELNDENKGGFYAHFTECLEVSRRDFYSTFGGIFYLGIMLSIVFIFATVLIIYYKQISEGYEDQSRFEIMQKVGMTKRDIRSTINAQMLMVFFLPLGAAVMHLGFAFPMIRKLLLLFSMTNVALFLQTTVISILVFAVFYTLVYKITSNVYYSIVSGGAKGEMAKN